MVPLFPGRLGDDAVAELAYRRHVEVAAVLEQAERLLSEVSDLFVDEEPIGGTDTATTTRSKDKR